MSKTTEVAYHVGLIRRAARRLEGSEFTGDALMDACLWVEWAGMPASYGLAATALEHTAFQKADHLALVLASRVGNPRVSPLPPLWPLLALLVLSWRDTVSAPGVVARAEVLGSEAEVRRGLSIVVYLIPELEDWLEGVSLDIPLWEQTLALPLAARKLALADTDM